MTYKKIDVRKSLMNYSVVTYATLALTALPSFAQTVAFSLATDTWNYSTGSPTVGFVNQTPALSATNSSGYSTKSGISVNFGATFVGTAVSGANFSGSVGSSMTSASGNLNPNGFLLSTQNNDSTGITDGITAPIDGGVVSSYQRWFFEFSEAVILDEFILQDVDNLTGGNGFRDIIAAEAYLPSGYISAFPSNTFNSALLPITGSGGVDASYTLGTSLSTGTLTIGSETILAAAPNINTSNPSSTPAVAAAVSFGTTPVRAFSIYAISNQSNVHRMALNNNSFQVSIVPEPSVSLLGILSTVGLLVKRRR
jgi:hypothetical protein